MIAIQWLEAHVKENNRQEAPTQEQLDEMDCLKELEFFETTCKISNTPTEVKKKMGQKTTDAVLQSQHDCMVVRVCQETFVEAQQSVQFVSDGHIIGSFQASFCNASDCSDYRGEKNFENE